MKRHLPWVLVCLILFHLDYACGQDSLNVTCLAQVEGWGYGYDFVLHDSIAIVASDYCGARIVDISEPEHPEEIAFFETDGSCRNVATIGNIAVVNAWYRLYFVDISDPSSPQEIGSYSGSSNSIYDMTMMGNHIILRQVYSGRVDIVDASNPSQPHLVWSSEDTLYVNGFCVQDSLLYIADEELAIFDLHNPNAPVFVGTTAIDGTIEDVVVAANYAYLLDGNTDDGTPVGIHIFDISDPDTPISSGVLNLSHEMEYLYNINGQLYAFSEPHVNQIAVINGAGTATLELVNYHYLKGLANKAAARNGSLFINTGYKGLRVFEDTQGQSLVEIGCIDPPMSISAVKIVNDYAYVGSSEGSVRLYDISNPAAPVQTGMCYTDYGTMNDLAYRDGIVYTLQSTYCLHIIDVHDPYNPAEAGSFGMCFDNMQAIELRDDYAFIAGFNGFHVFDISNPHFPAPLISLPTGGLLYTFVLHGDFAYCQMDNSLLIYDISNPHAPSLANTIVEYEFDGLEIAGNYLYTVENDSNLTVFSLENPTSPQLLNSITLPFRWCTLEACSNGRLFLSHEWDGMSIHSLTDPLNPEMVGRYITPGYFCDVDSQGDIACVADHDYFGIYDISGTVPITFPSPVPWHYEFTSYPNPFNSSTQIAFELPVKSRVHLTITDILGRQVADLIDAQLPAGSYRKPFQPESALASGLYFARLDAGAFHQVRKLMLIK